MPRRYEIVEEPEALEVIEDDVYNPDQSVSSINSIKFNRIRKSFLNFLDKNKLSSVITE